MGSLSILPNIGNVLENELNKIGVHTPEQLKQMGSRDAFLRIKLIDSGACLNKLYAIQAAVEGKRYPQLTESTKNDLKQFFRSLQE